MASNITQSIGAAAASVAQPSSPIITNKDQTAQPISQKDVAQASIAAARVASNTTKSTSHRSIQTSPTRVEAGFSSTENKKVNKDPESGADNATSTNQRPARAVA